jgi:hypothetical protein
MILASEPEEKNNLPNKRKIPTLERGEHLRHEKELVNARRQIL